MGADSGGRANAAHACEGFAPKRLLRCEGFAPKRLSLCEGFAPKWLLRCEGFAPKRLSLCEGWLDAQCVLASLSWREISTTGRAYMRSAHPVKCPSAHMREELLCECRAARCHARAPASLQCHLPSAPPAHKVSAPARSCMPGLSVSKRCGGLWVRAHYFCASGIAPLQAQLPSPSSSCTRR